MAIKSVQAVLPEIYAYSTPGVSYHDGWLKLGYTEQTADARVKQQTETAGIRVQIEWHEFAIYKERQKEWSSAKRLRKLRSFCKSQSRI